MHDIQVNLNQAPLDGGDPVSVPAGTDGKDDLASNSQAPTDDKASKKPEL